MYKVHEIRKHISITTTIFFTANKKSYDIWGLMKNVTGTGSNEHETQAQRLFDMKRKRRPTPPRVLTKELNSNKRAIQ